jgi:exodeoxyribonuclease VII small subunit
VTDPLDSQRGEDAQISFEDALQRLEQIVARLEDGQISLSESLQLYEQGIKYLRTCYRGLENAERKIELLTGVDQDGRPRTTPLDDQELSLSERAESTGRHRKTSKPSRPVAQQEPPPAGLF